MLPKELSKLVPKDHLMSETEWRSIGVQQSRGWQHYLIHEPGKNKNKLNSLKKQPKKKLMNMLLLFF